MVRPRISNKHKAPGPKTVGVEKLRHALEDWNLRANALVDPCDAPTKEESKLSTGPRPSQKKLNKSLGRKHEKRVKQSFHPKKVISEPPKPKPSIKKITSLDEDPRHGFVQMHQPAKNLQFLKSPKKVSNNSSEEQPRNSNTKKRKKSSSSSEARSNSRGICSAGPTKRRKLASKDNSGDAFEDEYPTHFSSDSDDSVGMEMPIDRKLQRERRRIQSERLSRTVFVGNLPPTVSKKFLKQFFNRALQADAKCTAERCSVQTVRFRGVVPLSGGSGKLARKRAVVQGEHSAGVSGNLLAYVVLSSKAGIPVALSLNGHWMDSNVHCVQPPTKATVEDAEEDNGAKVPNHSGRFIRVDLATKHRPTIKPQNCVFLGNLAFDLQEDEVREAFVRFGPIANVRLIRDRQTGAVKGIGYVQFDDVSAVSLAIRASQSISIRNRPVRVEECKPMTGDAVGATHPVGHGKQKRFGVKVITPKVGKVPTTTKAVTKPKVYIKLDQTGKARGITLPSNLRGSMRERYLAKRLQKKRKRQIHRQKKQEQQTQAASQADEAKGKQKIIKRKPKLRAKISKKDSMKKKMKTVAK